MPKQAVVLIHGMGEPRPMELVRGFARAMFPGKEGQIITKPDGQANLFDVRRIVVKDQNTEFFEFYWAHYIEAPKLFQVLWWFGRRIFFRWPWKAAALGGLQGIYWLFWAIMAGIVVSGLLTRILSETLPTLSRPWTLWTLVAGLVLIGFNWFIVYFFGDVVRYLSPIPENARMRQNVREAGVKLLRYLHDKGEYDQITVVAHSLGSIIGYDLLRLLWDQYNTCATYGERDPLTLLRQVSERGQAIRDEASLEAFRQAQAQLWQEQRELGNPWRITDFITFGSPLAHAAVLLDVSEGEIAQRIQERELATCPPQPDHQTKTFAYPKQTTKEPRVFALHHAALFGLTRWTNVYLPARLGLLGDFIGGPVAPIFGPGILDVPSRLPGAAMYSVAAHNNYWTRPQSLALGHLHRAIFAPQTLLARSSQPNQA